MIVCYGITMSPKYNRTFHLNWSPGATSDDKIAVNSASLLGVEIVITEKLDGGCCSIEHNGCYARTHANAPSHPSFDHIKALQSTYKHIIPDELQIFGENCFAEHSIHYSALPGYFLVFSVRDTKNNIWFAWNDVCSWAARLCVPTVPVLFRGKVETEKELRKLTEQLASEPSRCGGKREGVVVRAVHSFKDDDFPKFVQKWVRKGHVQTDDHWTKKTIVRNGLIR